MRNRNQHRVSVPLSLRRHRWVALGMLLAMALIFGCARQYHWYRCGCDCVNYNYCPPTPLPYSPYCSCPTPISSSYHRTLQGASSAEAQGTVGSTGQPAAK
jgi:hypothetical protein